MNLIFETFYGTFMRHFLGQNLVEGGVKIKDGKENENKN